MSKEILKSMLQDIINDRQEDASVKLHDYMVIKNRSVIGVTEASRDDYDDDGEDYEQDVRIESDSGDDITENDGLEARLDKAGIRHTGVFLKGGDRASVTVLGHVSETDVERALGSKYSITFINH